MWFQLQIQQCPCDEVDALSNRLENSGALSITLKDKNDDPILEPDIGSTPLWPEVNVFALYDDLGLCENVQQVLAVLYPQLTINIDPILDQDWQKTSIADFKPISFGTRLWICPSWHVPPEPQACNVILDPGLAFGTGAHPTTGLCLSWLDKADIENKSLVDYGCGSGILSLAAIKLGAAKVFAVDIDPQALIATQDNAAVNQINASQLEVGLPEALDGFQPVDIVMSNILLNPLLSLKDRFYALMKDNGTLLVTGLLSEQAALLIDAYQEEFELIENVESKGWSLLSFKVTTQVVDNFCFL